MYKNVLNVYPILKKAIREIAKDVYLLSEFPGSY
jgi:hypothetical protein